MSNRRGRIIGTAPQLTISAIPYQIPQKRPSGSENSVAGSVGTPRAALTADTWESGLLHPRDYNTSFISYGDAGDWIRKPSSGVCTNGDGTPRNAETVHRSRLIGCFSGFDRSRSGIDRLQRAGGPWASFRISHPPRSPDLNPIENM